MKIKFKYSRKSHRIIQLSNVAISHRLYVPKWTLRRTLCNPHSISIIVLGYMKDTPIAVATISDIPYRGDIYKDYLMVFVRKQHRKQGIGGKISRFAIKLSGKDPHEIKAYENKKRFFLRCVHPDLVMSK